ncbi:MAG: DUF1573 domain-containing protein [Bacteroidales bacterium]|nr:DUF1573 domain-containing protein [Bacteroidales bacterium]
MLSPTLRSLFRVVLPVVIGFASLTATAQLRLTHPTTNVGKLQWNVGRDITIEVENTGRKAAKLVRVATDCTCLVADFPTSPIAPGAKAMVVLRHTAPLLGTFTKSVHIYTSDSSEPLKARLTGQVLSEVDEDLYDFKYRIGDIALTANHVQFTDVSFGDYPQQVIHIQNTGERSYVPQLMHLPPYITATYEPTRLFRGRTGKITLTLNSNAIGQMGLTQGNLYLSRFGGDHVGPDNELAFSAVVHPALHALTTEQLLAAPVLQVSADTLYLSMPKPKAKLKARLTLSNTGQSNLIIGNAQVFHPAINFNLKATTIPPGQSTTLDIALVTKLIPHSKQPLRLLIVTNDPTHPQVYVDLIIQK